MILGQQNLQSPVYPIVRNMLEALIDLDNLVNVNGYEDYLAYIDIKEKLRLAKKNYFKGLMKDRESEYERRKREYQNQYEMLELKLKEEYGHKYCSSKGNKINTSVQFKFELAKSLDTYDTLYYITCGNAHNSLTALEECYIDKSMSVMPFNLISIDEVNRICETVESILEDSVDRINRIVREVK